MIMLAHGSIFEIFFSEKVSVLFGSILDLFFKLFFKCFNYTTVRTFVLLSFSTLWYFFDISNVWICLIF